MRRALLTLLVVGLVNGVGCRNPIGVREAPIKSWFRSLPTPRLATVQTPVTVAVVTNDRRPEYSTGILPGALFIPIIPYIVGDWQGVPVESCLTFPGTWGSGTEVAADYVHLIPLLIADTLRRSGAVAHAAYPANAAVLRQYELVLRLDFEDFGHTEGLITYGFPPIIGIPYVLWALGLPRGYVGAGGTFAWQLYEQASRTPLASGRVSAGSGTLLGFYYGGGSYPTAVAGVHRQLLPEAVEAVYDEVEKVLAEKPDAYWRDLVTQHRAWRSQGG